MVTIGQVAERMKKLGRPFTQASLDQTRQEMEQQEAKAKIATKMKKKQPAKAKRPRVRTPLSHRKEDIPLIVNNILRDRNRSGGPIARFIDLAGLRLLMELRRKRNVRTIKNFVDALMNARTSRTLSKKTFERITYEEIIQCVARTRYLEPAGGPSA